MEVKRFELGPLYSNLYLVYDGQGRGFMVDPVIKNEYVDKFIEENGIILSEIFITHTHFDHCMGANYYREKYNIPTKAHKLAREVKDDPTYNLSQMIGVEVNPEIDEYIDETYEDLAYPVTILETPGHSIDSISIKIEDKIFSGDSLFRLSVGRSDFPGGSPYALIDSIKNKLMTYDDQTLVFPGHGEKTILGFERTNNPFLN